MKLQKLAILLIIVISLVPVYALIKYFQKIIRPGESFGRLLLYMLLSLVTVFLFTFLVVFIIRKTFKPVT
ncbi:MAG: hypothetical protein ABI480_06355 [Chitinophagaceae bacterium]